MSQTNHTKSSDSQPLACSQEEEEANELDEQTDQIIQSKYPFNTIYFFNLL